MPFSGSSARAAGYHWPPRVLQTRLADARADPRLAVPAARLEVPLAGAARPIFC